VIVRICQPNQIGEHVRFRDAFFTLSILLRIQENLTSGPQEKEQKGIASETLHERFSPFNSIN
jgi:hypothetical protein